MTLSFKQTQIEQEFASCTSPEAIYQKIMEWGKKLPPFDPAWKTEKNIVPGCQSIMYLHAEKKENTLVFAADSDALISKGLAALLVFLYSGETPETILKQSPAFFEKMGIIGALTPGRANGFSSLYLRMKQEAVKALTKG